MGRGGSRTYGSPRLTLRRRRFAYVHVKNGTIIHTTNVHVLSYRPLRSELVQQKHTLTLDSQTFDVRDSGESLFRLTVAGVWEEVSDFHIRKHGVLTQLSKSEISGLDIPRHSGPISRILTSARPITIVVPQGGTASSVAGRLSWALYAYLGLDSTILSDTEALRGMGGLLQEGGVVVLSERRFNQYGRAVLETSPVTFKFSKDGSFEIQGQSFAEPGTGKTSPEMAIVSRF